MIAHHFLSADDHMLDNIEELLRSSKINYVRAPVRTLNQGLRTTDVIEIQCRDERGVVDLVIERRRTRKFIDLVLIPSRRLTFWRNRDSDRLSDHLATLLREHGARDL